MELDRLGDADCRRAVFAIVSDTSGLYSFLLAIMMRQAVNILCRRALIRYGGALPTHVSFLHDEFANIGRLPDIEKTIAVVRSRNVLVTVYLQSMSQLKSRYKDDAATIVDCCDTMVFLGGKSTDTVREISEVVGKETVGTLTWNETRRSSGSSTRNWNTVERDLMQPSEVARLPRDEAVVLISGAFPVRDRKYDPRRYPLWACVASGDAGAPAPFDFTEYRARLRGGGAEAKEGACADVRGRRPAEDRHPSRADTRRKEGWQVLSQIINLVSGCVTFLGGSLIVWGAVSLGLAIRENQGGPQLAIAISTIADGAIIVAAAVYFGMLDTSWLPARRHRLRNGSDKQGLACAGPFLVWLSVL